MTALIEIALTTGMFIVGGLARAGLVLGLLFALAVPLMLFAAAVRTAGEVLKHFTVHPTAPMHR